MKNKFKNKVLSFFFAFTMIIGFVPGFGVNNVIEAAGEYEAYHEIDSLNRPINNGHNLYVRPVGSTDKGEIVYCYNANLEFPSKDGDTDNIQQHTKLNASIADFESSTSGRNRIGGQELKDSV